MPEPNQIDLMLDRQQYTMLRLLATEILQRLNAIEGKYPPGTFSEEEEAGPEPRAESGAVEPPTVRSHKRRRRPNRPDGPRLGLSDTIRAELAAHGKVDVHELAAAHPHLNKQAMYPTLRSMAKVGKIRQDPENRAIYYLP